MQVIYRGQPHPSLTTSAGRPGCILGGRTGEVFTVDRIARITSLIDVARMKGIEIGALHHPLLQRAGTQVRYVDHASTEELREKYANDGSGEHVVETMVDVDYVWAPGKRLAEAIAGWGPVDYIVASHVIEHVADPIDWLDQAGEALADNAFLCLAIPDKRFTFDARRPASTIGQLIETHFRGATAPTTQQIFDHVVNFLPNSDTIALWNGRDPKTFRRQDNPAALAYRMCVEQGETGAYLDVHANVFTDDSFVEILAELAAIDLLPFAVAEFLPTKRYELEFVLTLQKLPESLTAKAKKARQEAGFALCRERLARADRIERSAYDAPPVLPSLPEVTAYVRNEGRKLARAAARKAKTGAASARDRTVTLRRRSERP